MSEFPKDDHPDDDATISSEAAVNDRRVAESEWLRETASGEQREPEAETLARKRSGLSSPRAVVCDLGELDDVYDLLIGLDQSPLRVRPGDVEQLRDWERPTQLFITTVRVALAHPLTLLQSPGGAIAIAIADSDAQTLCTAMLRRGFRYVVRRPVHPEALRLLLMQVLYTGREQRVVARFPFGGEVRWRVGWRTGSCTVTEISAHGCRLLTSERFTLDSLLHLRVPAALPSSRDLRLRGRVVRRSVSESAEGARASVAVRFVKLSERARAHLDALLAERASGPAPLQQAGAAPAHPEHEPRPSSRLMLSEEPELSPEEDLSSAPKRDRRRRPRVVFRQELVALDNEDSQVLYSLMGTELSTGGLRVEPHPLLRLGDDMKLALYDAEHTDPIVIDGRVAYDDGRRGWGVVFRNVSEEVAAQLEGMVASMPPVSSLSAEDEKPEAVVMGEIMSVVPAKRPR